MYSLHPTLLDACLQVSAVLFADEPVCETDDEVYLPVGLQRFTLHASNDPVEGHVSAWCVAQLRAVGGGTFSTDLSICSAGGRLLGTIEGLPIKKVAVKTLLGKEDWQRWLYQVSWQAQALPLPQVRAAAPAHWLMISDRGGLVEACARRLRSVDTRVTVVAPTDSEHEYGVLLQSLTHVTGVAFGAGLDASLPADCRSQLLQLVKALAVRGAMLPIYVITRGSVACGPQQPLTGLDQAPLWGMAKVIALEYPQSPCVCIDLDPDASAEQAATLLVAELGVRRRRSAGEVEEQVAYRRQLRYVARLARFAPTQMRPPAPSRQLDALLGGNMSPAVNLPEGGYQWDVAEKGRIETMRRVPLAGREPGVGEVEIAVQIHGANGIGYGYPVQCYMRDAKAMEIIEGTTQIQQVFID